MRGKVTKRAVDALKPSKADDVFPARRPLATKRLRDFAGLISLTLIATCGGESTAPKPQPTKLALVVQPGSTVAGTTITPALQVAVQDANGSTVTTATTSVTIAITSGGGAGGAVLVGTLTQAAVSGVATFADLKIEKAGTGYTLTAAAATLSSATSSAFDVTTASPAKLQIITQPTNVSAGAAISPAVQVAVQDAYGNAVNSATTDIAMAITSGSGVAGANLGGTLSQAAFAGIATFANLTINKAASGYTLTASATGLTSASTTAFAVAAAAPAKLAITAQPTNVTALASISPAVQVTVQDAFDNTVTTATSTTTLTITSGTGASGATLAGATTKDAVNGVATFSDLTIDKAASGYTLRATATGLTAANSSAFAVNAGVPSKLSFVVQPSGVSAGSAISPTVQIVVQDVAGNTVPAATTSITIAITIGTGTGGAVLSGTATQSATSGVASFSNLTIDKAASGYTLVANATGLTSATSSQFAVSPGPASKLAFTTQPSAAVSGTAIDPAVQVAVQDAFGNLVATSTANLTVAITNGTGAGGAALTGTTTQATASGVAAFADWKIDKASSGYTLTATATSLASATTSAFTVSPGAAANLLFSTHPTTVTSATSINPAVQVTVKDAQDNTVTSSTTSITVAITNSTGTVGAVAAGTLTQAAVSGVATFANLSIDKAGTNYTLTATASGLTSATSTTFSVNVGPASKLAFTVQPSAAAQSAAIAPAIQVSVQDAGANAITGSTASITVVITGGTGTAGAVLGGTVTVTAASGVVAFNNLAIDKPGSGYTLTASSSGLTNAVSNQFMINGGTISGTITLVSTFLSASSATRDALVVASKPQSEGAPTVAASLPSAMASKPNRFGAGVGASVAAKQPEAAYVSDELIVTFRPPVGVAQPSVRAMTVASLRDLNAAIRTEAQQLAGKTGAVIGSSPAIRAARIRLSDPSQMESVRASLERDPSVARVERNPLVFASERRVNAVGLTTATQSTPTDPAYVAQAWHYQAIDLDYAWGITTGSNSVIVAVVDDGIRFDHPDVAANLTSDGYDFVTNMIVALCGGGTVNLAGDGDGPDSNPTKPNAYTFNSSLGCYSADTGIGAHGLHVAGTIGASANNGQGGAGINWSVRIRPVRVLNSGGRGSNYDIAQGILYAAGLPADNGTATPVQALSPARVINLSLGGPSSSTVLQDAVAAAVANGSLIIAAAGNDGVSTPFYPAAYPEVISVSAVGPDLNLASYSNFGSTIDIAAPGGDLADGDASYGIYSTRWNFGSNSPTYAWINGTSMAAPHVAGVAALIIAQNPSLSASQVRARLENYAVDFGPVGRDDSYGFGLLNARNSLTQTTSLARSTRARLYNAVTGAVVADATVAANGSYAFSQVAAGTYWLFGGQDEDSDGLIGVPRRRWSAFGGTATPTAVTITGAATQTVSFNLGFAFELEANNTTGTADAIMLGGHLLGFASATDADYSTILIPSSGQYTFETQGYRGACGYAEELDTIIELYNSSGTLIASNDDINLGAFNYCSRITATLTVGRYYVRTLGYGSAFRRYRYYITARAG